MGDKELIDFKYWESEFYPEVMTKRGRETVKKASIGFWLHTKRGKKVYSQEFYNLLEESWRKEVPFERLLYHKLRELLIMLDRQLETGYLTELIGGYHQWDVRQRKLTKNTWITAERLS